MWSTLYGLVRRFGGWTNYVKHVYGGGERTKVLDD
jgi:hypothetical protein